MSHSAGTDERGVSRKHEVDRPLSPGAEWKRLGVFLAFGTAAEEIAFRGYALWRLMRVVGFWPAQAIVAALFVASHLTLGGYAFLPALIGTTTGSVLYGSAFAGTRGVAAPIALHTGWNVVQHLFLSPLDPSATPLVPTFPHVPTGREYAAMLAIVALVMVATTVVILTGRSTRVRHSRCGWQWTDILP